MKTRLLAAVAAAVWLAGCAADRPPPAPLKAVQAKIAGLVRTLHLVEVDPLGIGEPGATVGTGQAGVVSHQRRPFRPSARSVAA